MHEEVPLLGNHRTESLKFDIWTFGITVPLPDPWASTIGRWMTIWSVPRGYSQSASVSHFRHFYIEMELWYLRIINRMNSTEKKIITSESHSTRYGLLHAYILFLLFTESSRRVLMSSSFFLILVQLFTKLCILFISSFTKSGAINSKG